MRKIIFIFLVCSFALTAYSQRIKNDPRLYADSLIPRWCIDVNLKGGFLSENINTVNFAYAYPQALNDTISGLRFKNGSSFGIDAQVGCFLGPKRHWGIGLGLMYMWQQGDIYLDQFKVEYASTDRNNDVFRQVLSSNKQIKESVTMSNLTLPLVLKYKAQFSRRWGFTADAGLLFRLHMQNSYTSNAAFNYEAIYKFKQVGGQNVTVFDNAATPDPTDQIITQAFYNAHASGNTYSTAQEWFNAQYALGQNVGLNIHPNSTSGTVTYKGTLGFMIQPSITYRLTDFVFLNMGLYYIIQSFNSNDNNQNYKLTDKVGTYSSVMNGVTSSANSTYGLNLGLRFFLGGREHKHLPCCGHYTPSTDTTDWEWKYRQLARRMHSEDDSKYEEKTTTRTTRETVVYEEIPYKIVYFETAKYNLSRESRRKLDAIALFMKENADVNLRIKGNTDIVGTEKSNQVLSENRAETVKQYLEFKGIEPGRMSTKGFASRHPAATNHTFWGRAKNRRAEMEIIVK